MDSEIQRNKSLDDLALSLVPKDENHPLNELVVIPALYVDLAVQEEFHNDEILLCLLGSVNQSVNKEVSCQAKHEEIIVQGLDKMVYMRGCVIDRDQENE